MSLFFTVERTTLNPAASQNQIDWLELETYVCTGEPQHPLGELFPCCRVHCGRVHDGCVLRWADRDRLHPRHEAGQISGQTFIAANRNMPIEHLRCRGGRGGAACLRRTHPKTKRFCLWRYFCTITTFCNLKMMSVAYYLAGCRSCNVLKKFRILLFILIDPVRHLWFRILIKLNIKKKLSFITVPVLVRF